MDVAAIVVAAGAGERLADGRPGAAGVASARPKALVELAGVPLLVRSVRAFVIHPRIAAVVAVVGASWLDRARRLLDAAGLEVVTLCAGGSTRQASVSCGLAACPASAEVVAVHDAARPLVGAAVIDRALDALGENWDAVAPGLRVVDTLKLVDDGRGTVLRTVDRAGLWTVQTPQVFHRAALERVHARTASAADAATDDLALIERAGGRVRLVDGDARNLKVTFPDDLALAEALLAAEQPAPSA